MITCGNELLGKFFHKKVNKFKHNIGQPPLLCPQISHTLYFGQLSSESIPLIKEVDSS